MRALSPITLSHPVFLSHFVQVCSFSVVMMRSPLGRPQTATTFPLFPVLLSCSVSSWFIRVSLCPSLETMISLLCQLRTGFSTILVEGREEAAFPATAAYEGCCRACVLLSTFED